MRRAHSFGVLIALSGLAVAGCSGTIHKTSVLGEHNILSVDARQRLVVSGFAPNGQRVICSEPSPDALVAQAAALSGGGSGPLGVGGGKVEAKLAGSLSEAAASIGLRTQSIQLMRDGYFRLCEALINGQINPIDYRRVVLGIDQFMIAMLAIDTLGGTTRAPAVAIGVSGKGTVTSGSAEAATNAVAPDIEEIKATTKIYSDRAAAAVEKITIEYLKSSKIENKKYLAKILKY